MNRLKLFITARRVSLGLILLLAGLMCLSMFIPQAITSTPDKIAAWRRGHAVLIRLVDVFNLHGIYGQPWFAATILFAALALAVSTYDQLSAARKKLASTGTGRAQDLAESVTEGHLRSVARSHRYRPLRTTSPAQLKFSRNPWGYFGVFLLHAGMTLVLTASLYVSLTARQGVLILIEGERHDNRQPWDASEQGMFSSALELPDSIRLDKVRVSFDRKNQPTDVSSDLSIIGQSGKPRSITASINRICRYQGLRIYHTANYGDAFTVTFTDSAGGARSEKIMAQQPVSLDKAGYSSDFGVAWSPYLFDVKYYADAAEKSMTGGTPRLVIRMLKGTKEIARTVLMPGNSGMLGEYRVRLVKVEKWAKLIFVDISGMSVVFGGFAIIMLGGLLHYLTPPRDLIGIRGRDGRYRVYWKAVSFGDFFPDERDEVAAALRKGET